MRPQDVQTWRGRVSPAGTFSVTGAPQWLQKFMASFYPQAGCLK